MAMFLLLLGLVLYTTAFSNHRVSTYSIRTCGKPNCKSFAVNDPTTSPLQQAVEFWNQGRISDLLYQFDENCVVRDYAFRKELRGQDLERVVRLQRGVSESRRLQLEFIVIDDSTQFGALVRLDNKRGCFMGKLNDQGLIQEVDIVFEPTQKGGEATLKLVSIVTRFLEWLSTSGDVPTMDMQKNTLPHQYFRAWNRRDIQAALDLFATNVTYDDTAFPVPFAGKDKLRRHLELCAKCLPPTFGFQVDNVVSDNHQIVTKWHAENNGGPVPFARGMSYYAIDKDGLIDNGIDFVEPAGPIKPGAQQLFVESIKAKLTAEPARLIPLTVWVAYMYIVFFSDHILPGANALQLEQRTWQEVLDLSLNFFLVAPLLHLPFSPVVHPMLEGVFNLLLSWAALFAGFLSDDRRDKPNLLPMVPSLIGMQFLTSAVLLPYLVTRTTETRATVSQDQLSRLAQVCESPLLGAAMSIVGTGSIIWSLVGRQEFGGLMERWQSFLDLLSIDRVGSSFLVDLVIFGLFQGWLVDDDVQRRGRRVLPSLVLVAKFVPYFGMAAYLMLRPPISRKGAHNKTSCCKQ